MWYIRSTPDATGNYGNPQSNQIPGLLALPNNLLTDYIKTMGFAKLTISDSVVSGVEVNQAAYNAYQATRPQKTKPQPNKLEQLEIVLCELDAANETWKNNIETALCELDKGRQ